MIQAEFRSTGKTVQVEIVEKIHPCWYYFMPTTSVYNEYCPRMLFIGGNIPGGQSPLLSRHFLATNKLMAHSEIYN